MLLGLSRVVLGKARLESVESMFESGGAFRENSSEVIFEGMPEDEKKIIKELRAPWYRFIMK